MHPFGRLGKKTSFDDSEGRPRFNDPFDPYGWSSALTVRRVQFMDGVLHPFGRLGKKTSFDDSEGRPRLDDPFDPCGWSSALMVRRGQFTDRILHLIR